MLPWRCARTAPSRVPAGSWALTREELAPAGASAIRLCGYSGLNNHPPLRLARSVLRSDPSLVGELVQEFDRLPSAQGAYACPSDDGSEIVALLAYPDGHGVTVSVGLTGCETVTNGSVFRIAAGIGSPPAFRPATRRAAQTAHGFACPATRPRPPSPLVNTLGANRSASLVSYSWSQPTPGGGESGVVADGAAGHPAHALRWRPGAAVTIDLRYPPTTFNSRLPGSLGSEDRCATYSPSAQHRSIEAADDG